MSGPRRGQTDRPVELIGRVAACARSFDPKGLDILDVGASTGWYERYAIDHGARSVTAVDPDTQGLETGRTVAPEAKFVTGSATALPFKDNSFDAVAFFDVIEHLPKRTEPQALKEIYRVLRPGGFLSLSTPNRHLAARLADPAWYFGHRHYSTAQLTRLLTAAGFSDIRCTARGGWGDLVRIPTYYTSKWIFRDRLPMKALDRRTDAEYRRTGFMTNFALAAKPGRPAPRRTGKR